MKLKFSFVILLFFTMFSVKAEHVEFYVSKSGNDANSGTKENPVASLNAARDLIRHYKTINSYPGEGFTVWVNGGVYDLSSSFVLNDNDSGEPGKPIVWRVVEGEEVSLLGGKRIPSSHFKKVNNDSIKSRFRKEIAAEIYEVNLKELGILNYGKHQQYGHALSVCPAPLELFFNNEAMTLARYPNKGSIAIGKVIDGGSVPRYGDYTQRGAIFEYTDDRHEIWAKNKDIWFQGTFGNGYADDKILVDYINPQKKQVKFSSPHMYGVESGRDFHHYVALNILDEIDMPGEWYVDRETGMLYFYPPTDIKDATLTVSILEDPIVCLEGASHIVFRDFTVEVGRGIGIYLERGKNNLVAGCTVRNIGTSGIFMGQGAKQTVPYITHDHYEGVPVSRRIGNLQGHIYSNTTWDRKSGKNHKIQSCDVYNTGTGGIYLSGGNKRELIRGNNIVENCKVHDYNRRNKFLWSGINIDGVGNKISHCEIYNSDFQAIYAHGNEHVYEYNNIHHVTQHSDDVSIWYLGRDPSDRGNVLRYNYFHHCGSKERMNMGIYCDDSTTDVTVYGNVFYKIHTAQGVLYSNTGWDITMKNNIIIEPHSHSVVLNPHYYTWYKGKAPIVFAKGKLFEKRLSKDLNILEPPYSEQYPQLTNFMDVIVEGEDWEGMRSRRNVFSTNIIIGGHKNPVVIRNEDCGVFESINNYQTTEDPGFVDMENENFMLKDDAMIYKKLKGFKPIPFNKMGLYTDEFRTKL